MPWSARRSTRTPEPCSTPYLAWAVSTRRRRRRWTVRSAITWSRCRDVPSIPAVRPGRSSTRPGRSVSRPTRSRRRRRGGIRRPATSPGRRREGAGAPVRRGTMEVAVTSDRRIGVTYVRQDPAGLGSGPAEVALSSLIEALGQGLLDVVVAPRGLDLTVTDPVIFDPTYAHPAHEGELILGVGLTCDSEAARTLVAAAGRERAAAVVLRHGEADTDGVRTAAEASGVALLLIPATTGWEHVFTLLRTALEASR